MKIKIDPHFSLTLIARIFDIDHFLSPTVQSAEFDRLRTLKLGNKFGEFTLKCRALFIYRLFACCFTQLKRLRDGRGLGSLETLLDV